MLFADTQTSVSFFVETLPIPQPRQRHRIVWPARVSLPRDVDNPVTFLEWLKSNTFVQNYTETKHPVTDYKRALVRAAKTFYDGDPMEGPLVVNLDFVFPRPKNKCWKTKPMPRYRHVGTPDRDNLMKSTQDALNGILWVDDAKICAGVVQKWVAAGNELAGVHITVEQLESVV